MVQVKHAGPVRPRQQMTPAPTLDPLLVDREDAIVPGDRTNEAAPAAAPVKRRTVSSKMFMVAGETE
ncbi:hypothetical protein GCM10010109_91340 [Actinoplanes campanulatus]|nr:hypothetical protein GCM10010109_91340 [Actinoplanes campanulatus]GID42113.1 hypothetical protein Aca09nite_86190 [Actinoplanes campanulatus]